ncbi:MAG: DNA-processing protein DprA [Acidimicrobiales bacterium]|jgi:DNA processing protein
MGEEGWLGASRAFHGTAHDREVAPMSQVGLDSQRRLLALCAMRVEGSGIDWSLIAREAQTLDGLDSLWRGHINESSRAAESSREVLRRGLSDADSAFERVDVELAAAEDVGAQLITVLDRGYPANLRLIPNLPPFLFIRGALVDEDVRSVAVVGTRQPSDVGIKAATKMAALLAEQSVTVISGLARGIDTAAHRAALDAGGRTIAVIGTGITQCYPQENVSLSEEIHLQGAIVSQFWPTRSAGRDTFPRRNVVTSGLSQGTVVIEASSTSGAKMQARLALEHGKKVFLIHSLVTSQPWAQNYVAKRGAIEVHSVNEVISDIAPSDRVRRAGEQRQQLSFAIL